MNITLKGANCFGKVKAIPSKSYAHRIAICKFLSGENFLDVASDLPSNDILATKRCLSTLKNGQLTLDAGESGSTLRFLLPLCAAIGGEYKFIGQGRLLSRPNDQLFSVLRAHNVECESTSERIIVRGKLTSGQFNIRGDISSQYISSLLMALPLLDGDSTINLTTPLSSSAYVDITLEVLKAFNIDVKMTDYGYFIKGNQKYQGDISVEGDWSNGAFFLVLGAINGDITVSGLDINSKQADRAILDILTLSGVEFDMEKTSFRVKKSVIKPFEFDADGCPDLVPIASVLASCADGVSTIKNVQRLRLKESDRIESTINMLGAFSVRAQMVGDDLVVYGKRASAGVVDGANDHRIVMSASVLATMVDGLTTITDANAVNKSYPSFFEDYKKVGGVVLDE